MKKAPVLAALAVLALLQAGVYWSSDLVDRAAAVAAPPAERVPLLERATRINPWNDRAYAELGRAEFERGAESLGEAGARDASFARSARSFLKSLRLNPGSAATHFHFAQTLQYLAYLSLPAPAPSFEEFKTAASLTGHNSQVYAEVGKVLLARWSSLRPEEQEFTLAILKKTLAGKDPLKIRDVLEVWYLNLRDYAVVDSILPDDAGALRIYGRFLGEKSLSLEEREKALARAELLDFAAAKADLEQGQRNFDYGQIDEAVPRLTSSLRLLRSIVFYQALTHQHLIDAGDYAQTLKTAYLALAKAQIERSRSLADPDAYLETYLALEDQPLAVGELEKFLAERGLLENDESSAARPKDLRTLALETVLDFKQNRYRDITKRGEALETGPFIIPDAGRPYYARILGLVGDSYMKLDYLYAAEKSYLKALTVSPGDLDGLFRLEKCYERLSSDEKLAEVRERIKSRLAPPVVELGPRVVARDAPVRVELVCDGQPLTMTVAFEPPQAGARPLLTAYWNGRVVWEAYIEGGAVPLSALTNPGANSLVLEATAEPVTLLKINRAAKTPGR